MILDFRSYLPTLTKIENFKHNFNEKSLKLTSLIRFLLLRGKRTSAKVADYA
jgi:hypothetical protein